MAADSDAGWVDVTPTPAAKPEDEGWKDVSPSPPVGKAKPTRFEVGPQERGYMGQTFAPFDAAATAKGVGKTLAGMLVEPVLAVGSGAIAAPVSGLVGLGRTAVGMVPRSLGGMGESLGEAAAAGGGMARRVQETATYQPRTEMGQAAMGMASAPFQMASEGLGAAGEAAGALVGPRTAAAGRTLGEAAPEAAGALLQARGVAGARMQGRAPLTQAQRAIEEAQQKGFKSLPSEAKPGLTRSTLEAAALRPQLVKDLIRDNEVTATNLVKQDLGLPPTANLDARTLGRLRDSAGAVYDRVRNAPGPIDIARTDPNFYTAVRDLDAQFRSMKAVLPELYNQPGLERLRAGLGRMTSVTPAEAIDIVRNLRDTASNTFRNQAASDSALTAARAMRNGADLLEGLLERHLQNLSAPPRPIRPGMSAADIQAEVAAAGQARQAVGQNYGQLYQDFTAARQLIAKTYDAQAMSDLVKGVVDPQTARRMMEKDVPLTGGMLDVARAAAAMPNVVRSLEGTGVRAEGGTRMLTSAPARAAVLSERYQRGLRPQGAPVRGPVGTGQIAAGTMFQMSEEPQE